MDQFAFGKTIEDLMHYVLTVSTIEGRQPLNRLEPYQILLKDMENDPKREWNLKAERPSGRPLDGVFINYANERIKSTETAARDYTTMIAGCNTVTALRKWKATNWFNSERRLNVLFCPKLNEAWALKHCFRGGKTRQRDNWDMPRKLLLLLCNS